MQPPVMETLSRIQRFGDMSGAPTPDILREFSDIAGTAVVIPPWMHWALYAFAAFLGLFAIALVTFQMWMVWKCLRFILRLLPTGLVVTTVSYPFKAAAGLVTSFRIRYNSHFISKSWADGPLVSYDGSIPDGPLPQYTLKLEVQNGIKYNMVYDKSDKLVGVIDGIVAFAETPEQPLLDIVHEMRLPSSRPIETKTCPHAWSCTVELRTEMGEVNGYGTRVKWGGESLLVTASHVAECSHSFNGVQAKTPISVLLSKFKKASVGDVTVYVVDDVTWTTLQVSQAKPAHLSSEGKLTMALRQAGKYYQSFGRFHSVAGKEYQKAYPFSFFHSISTEKGHSGLSITNERGAIVAVHSSGVRTAQRNLGLGLIPVLQVLLPLGPTQVEPESQTERTKVFEYVTDKFRYVIDEAEQGREGKKERRAQMVGNNIWTTTDHPALSWADWPEDYEVMVDIPDYASEHSAPVEHNCAENKSSGVADKPLSVVDLVKTKTQLEESERKRAQQRAELEELRNRLAEQEARFRENPPPPVDIPPIPPVDFQEPAVAQRVNKTASQTPQAESPRTTKSESSSLNDLKTLERRVDQMAGTLGNIQGLLQSLTLDQRKSRKDSPPSPKSTKSRLEHSPRSQSSKSGSIRSESRTATSSKTSNASGAQRQASPKSRTSNARPTDGSPQ